MLGFLLVFISQTNVESLKTEKPRVVYWFFIISFLLFFFILGVKPKASLANTSPLMGISNLSTFFFKAGSDQVTHADFDLGL